MNPHMMKATRRTPTATKEKVSRRPGGMKQTPMYKKIITMELYGTDPSELQIVAAAAHKGANSHPLCTGGKKARKVTVSKGNSDTPKKIFDGIV
jgi:hypothetical protein